MKTSLRAALAAMLLLAAIMGAYRAVLTFGFVSFDDNVHVYANPHVTDPSPAKLLDFWRAPRKNLYMPLTFTLWAAQARLSTALHGGAGAVDPAVFHGANLLLHGLNALLVLFILMRLAPGTAAPLAGALLFALHPVQTESVAWISEFKGLLAAFFALAATAAYLRRAQGGGRGWLAAGLGLFCLALLSKPVSAALPPMLFALDVLAVGRPWRRAARDLWPWILPLVPLCLMTRAIQPAADLGWVPPLPLRPFVYLDALAFYLGKLLLPTSLGIDYGRAPQQVLSAWRGYATWLAPAAAWALVLARRELRFLAAPLAVMCLGLLPVSGLVPFDFQRYSTVADRYLYLPMLGPSLGLAMILARLQERRPKAMALALGLVLCLAAPAARQAATWRDNFTLYGHALAVNPVSAAARLNLGAALASAGRPADALVQDSLAASLFQAKGPAFNRDAARARHNAAACLAGLGRLDEALDQGRLALELWPDFLDARLYRAGLLADAGRPDEAARDYAAAAEKRPGSAEIRANLGLALLAAGRPAEAAASLAEACRLNPALPGLREKLAEALARAENAAN